MVVLFLDGGVLNSDSKHLDYWGGDEIGIGSDTVKLSDVERIFADKDAYTDWIANELIIAQKDLLELKDKGITEGERYEETADMVENFRARFIYALTM